MAKLLTRKQTLADGTFAAGPTDPNQFPVQVAQRLMPAGWQIVADKLDGLTGVPPVRWYPINYPAALYPMAASVQAGRENLVAAIVSAPGPIMLCGYSQGAIVTGVVWAQDILASGGVLHDRLADVLGCSTSVTRCAARVSPWCSRPPYSMATGEAIINGLTFAAAGANAPHFRYGPYVPAVANEIRRLAAQSAARAAA